jgi:MFS family permease
MSIATQASIDAAQPMVDDARPSMRWAWYGLLTLIVVSLMGNIIKSMITLVSEPMKLSMELSDTQIGSLNGLALTLTTALATIPMGWLADKVDRRWLLAVSVIIWSLATVAFGLSTSFPMLFGFAMGIAIGEAVLGPITYAMIPDMFPRDKWIAANFVFYIAVLVSFSAGIGASGALLGWLGGKPALLPAALTGLDPWRAALVLTACSAPILVAMLLAMRIKRAPETVLAEGVKPTGLTAYFMANRQSIAGVFVGFGLSYAALGAQAAWVPVILQRLFGEQPAQIGQSLAPVMIAASLGGVGLSWIGVKRLRPRLGDDAPMTVAQFGLLMGLLTSLALPFVQTAVQLYAVIGIKMLFTTMAMSLSPAVLQFLAPAHMRGRVVAIGGMITVMFSSIMPPAIGFLSDKVFDGPAGILQAMTVIIIPALLIGLLFLRWGAVTLPETIRAGSASEA